MVNDWKSWSGMVAVKRGAELGEAKLLRSKEASGGDSEGRGGIGVGL